MKHTPILLFILCFLLGNTASAQRNYPVRATVQYTPPYSLFLGDYATPKLIITLTGQDLLDANCPYKLSISLECQNVKVTTKPSYTPAPLYINGGQTIVLTGADLARYFDIQNLDFHGITAAKYLQDGQLPEGFYRMNVKVIHYHENRVINNTAFTMFNARMGKPPVLSLPKNKTLIPPAQQQSPIVFTWIPKTVGAFNYKFELWECTVPGIPVQTVVSTVRPIYSQTYTTSQISFHPATVNMKPGMEYAWRITVEDPHNQQKFANQGQSEIFTFTYKRKPEPVTGLRFSNRGLKITWTWDMDPAHTKYYFEYYDPQTGRTIDPVACDYAEFVRNMPKSGYHLKARVRAESYGDPTLMSDYTPYLDTYLEPIPVPEYECGKVFEDREITNLELKHTFTPGEIVESKNGDTRYEIIFSEEKNGYLSGQFYMIMDCWGGAKIKCEFSKTQINTDNIVLNTIFHNVPDSTLYVKPETIRKEIQEAFFDAATVLTDFSIKDTVKIDKPYTYLYINESGKVMAVIDDKGKIKTEETTISATNLKENTLIQGKNGEELVLTKKGQVMGKTEFNATGGNSVLLKEYHRKSDSLAQWQINFSKYDAQTYAFDHIGSGNHGIFSGADYYPQSGSYDFRYKSVECGKNDKVIVEFGAYPQADSVVFKDKYGVTYPISSKDNVLSFTGVSKADTNYIYAYRGDKKIGKLFLNTYQQKTYKVVFVRVNGAAKKLNAKEITKYLNKVYNQCAVSFEDSIDNITIGNLTSFSHGGSGILTVYNDYQKEVLQVYEKEKKMKDGVFYLFFIDNVTDKKDGSGTPVSGYMPRGYNCGFIYDGGSERTIAHELGHGIAGLEHVFENSNNSGKTANLMDYSFAKNAEELWHFQWDQIQDPSRVWMKWNKAESEGEENQILEDPICLRKFLEAFRRAYAYNEALEYEADGWPYFGHRASDIQLLDGIVYKHIRKNMILNYVFSPHSAQYTKTQYSNSTVYSYRCQSNWTPRCNGNILSFSTEDKIESFEKYMFPDKKTYDSQIDPVVQIISRNRERDKVLEQLSVLPQQDYSRFTTDVKMRLLNLILSEDNPSIKINCNCVDELEVFINILSAVTEDEYPSLIQTLLGDRYPKLLTYIKNENYSEVMRLLCNAYVRTYYTALDRGHFTNEELNQPSLNPILDNLSKPKPSYYDYNSVNNKQFKFENGYYTFNGVGWRPWAIINVIGLDNNPEVANILNPKTDFKGTSIVAMPVFFLDFLIKKNNQLDETTKNILRTISLNGALLPIEDIYILVTGTDFDGNESDRLVAGGFVALDVIQAGKVFKLAKVTTIAKGGRVIKFLNKNLLKSMSKEALDNVLVDISCQFVANLIKYLALEEEIKTKLDFENAMIKAFKDIDVKGPVLDASFNITNKDNVWISTSLVCVREMLSKMQNEGVEVDAFWEGNRNCIVEIVAALFQHYAFNQGKFPILDLNQQKKVKTAFNLVLNPNSDCYKSLETILKYLAKKN